MAASIGPAAQWGRAESDTTDATQQQQQQLRGAGTTRRFTLEDAQHHEDPTVVALSKSQLPEMTVLPLLYSPLPK